MPDYCVVFYRIEDKHSQVVGIADPDLKRDVPVKFSFEEAENYIQQRLGHAISRNYDFAKIHELDNGKVGRVFKTMKLEWVVVDNSTPLAGLRKL